MRGVNRPEVWVTVSGTRVARCCSRSSCRRPRTRATKSPRFSSAGPPPTTPRPAQDHPPPPPPGSDQEQPPPDRASFFSSGPRDCSPPQDQVFCEKRHVGAWAATLLYWQVQNVNSRSEPESRTQRWQNERFGPRSTSQIQAQTLNLH